MPRTKKSAVRRRTRGEGTVYEKTRTWKTLDGRTRSKKLWVAAISEGFVTEDGRSRRQRRFFYGKTAAEARAARDRYLADAGKAVPEPELDSTTVAEFARDFLQHAQTSTRAMTQRSYEQVLRLHVLPEIGTFPLRDLSAEQVRAMYHRLKPKVSASMRARIHVVLRAMLNYAVESGGLSASPLASIRKDVPRYKRRAVEALTEAQARALLRAASGHRLESLFVLALTSGLRQGELFALRWRDVDLTRGSLFVARSAQEIDGEVTFVEPKTDSSRRRIMLSKAAIAALRSRRSVADSDGHKSDLVFPSERGHPLRKSNFIRRVWEPLRKKAKITATFHSLRHTAASLLLAEGIHPKIVQEMLGHSSIRLTLDTYSHLIPTMQAGAAAAFDRVLGRSSRKAEGT
jgi:integrase